MSGYSRAHQAPSAKRGGRIAFQNAVTIYDHMAKSATVRPAAELLEFGYPAQIGEELLVFEGHVTISAGEETGLLSSGITQALAQLKAMNAITLIITGNKIRKSIYLLNYKPTMEQYENFMGRSYAIERKTMPNRWDSMVNDMVVLRQRLDAVEKELREHTHGGHII